MGRAREYGLLLRMTATERQLLESLAGAMSMKLGDAVRNAIREAAKRRGVSLTQAPATVRRAR